MTVPVGFVQNYNFVSTGGKVHFFGGEHFDAITDDIDTAIVGSIQFQNGFFHELWAEKLIGQTEDTGRLTDTRRTGEQ